MQSLFSLTACGKRFNFPFSPGFILGLFANARLKPQFKAHAVTPGS
jgi:hypothetical protein